MAYLPKVSGQSVEEFDSQAEKIIACAMRELMRFKNEIAHHGEDSQRRIEIGFDFTQRMLKGNLFLSVI